MRYLLRKYLLRLGHCERWGTKQGPSRVNNDILFILFSWWLQCPNAAQAEGSGKAFKQEGQFIFPSLRGWELSTELQMAASLTMWGSPSVVKEDKHDSQSRIEFVIDSVLWAMAV